MHYLTVGGYQLCPLDWVQRLLQLDDHANEWKGRAELSKPAEAWVYTNK